MKKKYQRRGSLLNAKDLIQARRRLSVVSAAPNQKLYKLDGADENAKEPGNAALTSAERTKCYSTFSILSQVGYVPFNPFKVNQDRGIQFRFKTDEKCIFGVFDGHGSLGHLVSQHVCTELPPLIVSQKNFQSDPKAALTKAFVSCNKAMAKGNVDCTFSGTTAIVCYINGRTVYSCNAGDSRAVVGRMVEGKLTAVPLSDDQKPERADECARVTARGARVEACKDVKGNDIGPLRVWLKSQDVPGLAMTRSFGDLIGASVGVIAEPEVWETTLTDNDKFMILASDGVWEFITSQEAVDIVAQCKTAEEACKALADESTVRWKAEEDVIDDITALVVFL